MFSRRIPIISVSGKVPSEVDERRWRHTGKVEKLDLLMRRRDGRERDGGGCGQHGEVVQDVRFDGDGRGVEDAKVQE